YWPDVVPYSKYPSIRSLAKALTVIDRSLARPSTRDTKRNAASSGGSANAPGFFLGPLPPGMGLSSAFADRPNQPSVEAMISRTVLRVGKNLMGVHLSLDPTEQEHCLDLAVGIGRLGHDQIL